jgi:UDP-MurNAc hydroxylase
MKVRYIYSASVVVETPDVSIVSDPWFTQGAEYGAWYHYPPLPGDAVDTIGKVDVIYISHIHTDHYDPVFLRRYLEEYPDTELLISTMSRNLLASRMKADGFNPTVASEKQYGETKVWLSVNKGYDYDMDTAMLIVHGEQSVANMNDNRIDEKQIEFFRSLCPGGRPTFAMLTFAGAGPYPQSYHFDKDEDRKAAEDKKRTQFLRMYQRYCELLDPVRAMPFAGAYLLGGPLAKYNPGRGIADAVDVLGLDGCGERSIVLADGGKAEIDLDTLEATAFRTEAYDSNDVARFTDSIDFPGYHYEHEFVPMGDKPLPLKRLCAAAYKNTIARNRTNDAWWICFKPSNHDTYLVLNTGRDEGVSEMESVDHLDRRWELLLDERLLFLLLTGYYHWGNAEGGSHFACKRVPNEYIEEVHDFLYFLMI